MGTTVIPIHWFELILATGFMLVAGSISMAMSLNLTRSLLIATIRTYLQLIALGFVLTWIFQVNTVYLVLSVFFMMMLMTAHIILGNIKRKPKNLYVCTMIAVCVSTVIVTFSVTGLVIHTDPWYEARYVLTIGGMILGNTMHGIALALERLFDDLRKRHAEVQQILAFGGTPWEASLSSIRTALNAGLMPTINMMNAVGLVSIPGMMTGQLLAGANPVDAVKYQIIVMLMISAATAIATMLGIYLMYKRAFNQDWQFTLQP